jgi:hypothetical protein
MNSSDGPAQLYVTVHQPLSFAGPRLRSYPIEASPTESVADFKARMESVVGVAKDNMTVIYQSQKRGDTQRLVEEEAFAANAPDNRCHIHIRVEDPALEARVQAIIAGGLQSLLIPLDEIQIVDK